MKFKLEKLEKDTGVKEVIEELNQKVLFLATSDPFVEKAKKFAIKSHDGVNHKYDNLPYSTHLEPVYSYAVKYAYLLTNKQGILSWDDLIVIFSSAWCHDCIEDCRKTWNDLNKHLGRRIANIVYALSNEKGKTRKERANKKYYKGIRKEQFADYLKICDRLGNLSYSTQSQSNMLEVYRKEYKHFKKELYSKKYDPMFKELEQILKIENEKNEFVSFNNRGTWRFLFNRFRF